LDNGDLFYPSAGDVGILFSPNGSVEALSVNGLLQRPTQTIHLLLGKLTVSSDVDNNWFDLKNIIVSINPQTGTISTNPVYPPYFNTNNPGPPFANEPPANVQNQFDPENPPKITDTPNSNFIQALFYSRKFAREAQTMGGKR
jgi:hypothetical protein